MAYSPSLPPALIAQGIAGKHRIWFYVSADAPSAIRVNGYFTNGFALGMRVNDLLIAVNTAASPLAMQLFIVNQSSASAGVDVSDGTAITATDTD